MYDTCYKAKDDLELPPHLPASTFKVHHHWELVQLDSKTEKNVRSYIAGPSILEKERWFY